MRQQNEKKGQEKWNVGEGGDEVDSGCNLIC